MLLERRAHLAALAVKCEQSFRQRSVSEAILVEQRVKDGGHGRGGGTMDVAARPSHFGGEKIEEREVAEARKERDHGLRVDRARSSARLEIRTRDQRRLSEHGKKRAEHAARSARCGHELRDVEGAR